MKEQLQKDFYNSIKNLSLSQKDIEIKKFCLDNFIDKGFPNKKEEEQILTASSSALIELTTGGGKTVLALKILEMLKKKTIIFERQKNECILKKLCFNH